eukprot:CAMPEP_0178497388 /NCGR_PEP_ID=MMETSP0696-20121128/14654_1 /TAXON_ID=265572 /ORGANISM="Extubocellulus spinifer, Strain CCMP396" /LENGTH=316 /DNA_ID=CAMNT_0020125795 /DNA_START=83 /DNA_END=1034 /DNA_ORIENTATION=-
MKLNYVSTTSTLILSWLLISAVVADKQSNLRGGTARRRHLKKKQRNKNRNKNRNNRRSDDRSGVANNVNRIINEYPQGGGGGGGGYQGQGTPGPRYGSYWGNTKPPGAVNYGGNPQQAGGQYPYGYNNGQYHPGLDPTTGQLNSNARQSRDPGNNGYGGLPPGLQNPTTGPASSKIPVYYPGGAGPQQPPSEEAVVNRAGAGYEGGTATQTHSIQGGSGLTFNVWRVKSADATENGEAEEEEEEIIIDENTGAAAVIGQNRIQAPPKQNIPTWPHLTYPRVVLPPPNQQCDFHDQCQSGCCVLNVVGICMAAGVCE